MEYWSAGQLKRLCHLKKPWNIRAIMKHPDEPAPLVGSSSPNNNYIDEP
jgi:hypothetical protein